MDPADFSPRVAACRRLADRRKRAGLSQDEFAPLVGLNHKGSVSAIETATLPPSLDVALRIQVWSGGEVQAGELRPDDAQLLDDAARTHRVRPPEAARTTPAEAAA